jgi:uncharacterized protein YyaL (SSP411 family)
MGHFAAAYARVVDMFLNPPAEVRIVGDLAQPEAAALHSAALTLPVATRIVQVLHPSRDADRLKALALPAEPCPVAYACTGATCSAPVQDPADLLMAVEEMRKAGS